MIKGLYSVFGFLGLVFALIVLSGGMGVWSGLGSHIQQVFYELPILLAIFFLYYRVQAERQSVFRKAFNSFLPIAFIYLCFDAYYISFNQTFRIADLVNLVELVQVLAFWQLLLVMLVFVFPIAWFVYLMDKTRLSRAVLPTLFIVGLIVWVYLVPNRFISFYKSISGEGFYQHRIVADYGRLSSTLYFEAQRVSALQKLEGVSAGLNNDYLQTAAQQITDKKDVFIIVLESFVHPGSFKTLEKMKLPDTGQGLFQIKQKMDYSQSPVFGGQTARAEFEVLCGVPSYAKFGANEFNYMEDSGLACLPNILSKAGYLTIGSNPYKPHYFNENAAYKNMGFEERHFLQAYSNEETYLDIPLPAKGYVFDGDVFKKNMTYIKKLKQAEPNRPILNYILTVYGHNPFHLHPNQSKPVEFQEDVPEYLQRSINMGWHTLEALNQYLTEIEMHFPQAIVLVLGDHLPSLPTGSETYLEYGYAKTYEKPLYQTPRLFLKDGVRLEQGQRVKHHEWSGKILQFLSEKKSPIQHLTIEEKSNLYDSMMSQTLRMQDSSE